MPTPRVNNVFLLPGEHFTGDARHRISTLLGSCVSITLWHPRLLVGAMSHFLLPGSATEQGQPPNARNARYGGDALTMMMADLGLRGADPAECEAKVFGGGAMFKVPDRLGKDIGRRNGESARAMLAAANIRIVSESLFEEGHQRIVFTIRTGEVWVRHAHPEKLHSGTARRLREELR
ncbi:MAG TPA: chemotaxis protein CheD [Burkholderiaceae bacterium]|jgi:chemotaxis protein CheD